MTTQIKESVEELKKLKSKQRTLKHQKRFMLLILLKSGECASLAAAAKQLGISPRTVDRIMRAYRESGTGALSLPDQQRRFSKLITPEVHQKLKVKLNDSGTPLKGYWHAQEWLKEEFGIDIAYHTLRSYLIKYFGTKLKTPRKSHYKSDKKAQEAFLKTPQNIQRA